MLMDMDDLRAQIKGLEIYKQDAQVKVATLIKEAQKYKLELETQ